MPRGKLRKYNGHRSWNAWNIALWIGNDEPLYRLAIESIEKARKAHWYTDKPTDNQIASRAVENFCRWAVCLGDKTPDGAVYNRLSIKLALLGFME